jgi:hypothetical protein
MNHDEIIREVRAIRDRLAAREGYDVRALYDEAKQRQQGSNRKIVDLKPRLLAVVREKISQ